MHTHTHRDTTCQINVNRNIEEEVREEERTKCRAKKMEKSEMLTKLNLKEEVESINLKKTKMAKKK